MTPHRKYILFRQRLVPGTLVKQFVSTTMTFRIVDAGLTELTLRDVARGVETRRSRLSLERDLVDGRMEIG